jgi:imidazolonepropionase
LLTLSGEDGPRRGLAAREFRIINDGSVLVQSGRIVEVGPSRRLDKLAASRNAEEIDATGRVVMPGFVDASASLLCGPPRYGGESFACSVAAVREWSAQRMEMVAKGRLRHFVRGGITTLAASCGYGLDEATEMKALRVLAALADRLIRIEPTYRADLRLPPEYEGRAQDRRRWLAEAMLPLVAAKRAASGVECTAELERAVRTVGLAARVWRGRRLEGNGVAILPPGEPPPPDMPFALTTAFDATESPVMGMQPVLWRACREFGMSPEDAIAASTINAAFGLGLQRRVGSLEPGKDADLIILQSGDYRDLCWYSGVAMVGMVVKGGLEIFPRLEVV